MADTKGGVMRTFLSTLGLCYFLIIAQPAAALIEEVVVMPDEPEEGDILYVDVDGYLPDSCWNLAGTSQEVAGQELRVVIDAVDSWEPGISCLTIITDYDAFFDFAGLAAGSYTLVVTERRDSVRDPEDQVIVLPVEITGPVAAAGGSWSAVKALYR
jgi:hypothetical protein